MDQTSIVVLDTQLLNLISAPGTEPDNSACLQWLNNQIERGRRILVPDIADYEVRRELIRANQAEALLRLDLFSTTLEYVPITSQAMLKAADLWALVRQQEPSITDSLALNGEMILCGQILTLDIPAEEIVVATTQSNHLDRFLKMRPWQEIV